MNPSIGQRIKQLRLQKGWSQETLASKLHVSNRTISNWEQGKRSIHPEQLEAIASVFSLDVSSLFRLSPSSTGRLKAITIQSFSAHIRLRRWFMVTFTIQLGMSLIPFPDPVSVALVSLFAWLTFVGFGVASWFKWKAAQHTTWLIPYTVEVQFKTNITLKERKTSYWRFIAQWVYIGILFFLLHSVWFTILQANQEFGLLTFFALTSILSIIVYLVILWSWIQRGVLSDVLSHNQYKNFLSLRWIRFWTVTQWTMMTIFTVFSLGWSLLSFDGVIVMILVLSSLAMLLYLSHIDHQLSRFYRTYLMVD